MNRREILKQLAVLTGGMVLVPACDFSKNDILLAYDHLQITEGHKDILQKVCNTVIPSDPPYKGSDELTLSDFVLVMMDDCYGPDEQMKFTKGLDKFNNYVNQQTRQNFDSLEQEQAEKLLRKILEHEIPEGVEDKGKTAEEFNQIRYFVQTVKSLTIQGYMASEYIMTEVMPYKMLPGEFHGKVRIQENEKVNIYD